MGYRCNERADVGVCVEEAHVAELADLRGVPAHTRLDSEGAEGQASVEMQARGGRARMWKTHAPDFG